MTNGKTILMVVVITLDKDLGEGQWSNKDNTMVLVKVVTRRDIDRDLILADRVDHHKDNSNNNTVTTKDHLTSTRSSDNSLHRLVTNEDMINVNSEEPSLHHTTTKVTKIKIGQSRDSLNNRCQDTRWISMRTMSNNMIPMEIIMSPITTVITDSSSRIEAEVTEEETLQEVQWGKRKVHGISH